MPPCGIGLETAVITPSVIDDNHIAACIQEYFNDASDYFDTEADEKAPEGWETEANKRGQEIVYDGPHFFVVEGADVEGWENRATLNITGLCGRTYILEPQIYDGEPAYSLEGAEE